MHSITVTFDCSATQIKTNIENGLKMKIQAELVIIIV